MKAKTDLLHDNSGSSLRRVFTDCAFIFYRYFWSDLRYRPECGVCNPVGTAGQTGLYRPLLNELEMERLYPD